MHTKGSANALGNRKQPPGETASELVHRHLADKTHEITEDEIRNVALNLHTDPTDEPDVDTDKAEVRLKELDHQTGKDKDDPDDKIVSPADILGS